MLYNNESSEALLALGKLVAIKALVDNGFEPIRNLKVDETHDDFAELFAEKDGKKHLIKIVARSRYSRVGKLDDRFRLSAEVQEKVSQQCAEYQAEPYWMAVSFESDHYSIYLGSFTLLNGKNMIPMGEKHFDQYRCLAKKVNINIDFGPYLN